MKVMPRARFICVTNIKQYTNSGSHSIKIAHEREHCVKYTYIYVCFYIGQHLTYELANVRNTKNENSKKSNSLRGKNERISSNKPISEIKELPQQSINMFKIDLLIGVSLQFDMASELHKIQREEHAIN